MIARCGGLRSAADRFLLRKAYAVDLLRWRGHAIPLAHQLPNPNQIQRATKTVDEVLATWEESATAEPPLTTAEWEQNWWAIRQEMQQRDQQPEPRLDHLSDDHG